MEKKTFKIRPKGAAAPSQAPVRIPITLGEEVDAALAEWYGSRGLPIPPEEVGLGAQIDAAERARFAEEMRIARVMAGEEPEVPLEPGAAETPEGKAARLRALVGPKPEFGSDAFWSWARRKRAADDAERAAAGLPPLPTAKEKATAKAAAKAEKAAAKATKK